MLLTLGGLNSLTWSHWGLTSASPFPGVFAKVPRWLVEQDFSLISRVSMAWGLLHGECEEFHGICVQDRIVIPKIGA